MGWRYFGRLHDPDSGRQIAVVDHVVDLDARLVRFRWTEEGGRRAEASHQGHGIQVWVQEPAGERSQLIAGAKVVWSASPSSLFVADRLLGNSPTLEVIGVRLVPPFLPEPVLVRLGRGGSRTVTTASGEVSGSDMDVGVDGWSTRALVSADLLLRADDWFELVGMEGAV
jgi:hypothetical protein